MNKGQNEQGSFEWKKERYGKIGGTALKDLMVDKDVQDLPLFYKLISQRTEDFFDEESFINSAMQRGLDLEPDAIAATEEYTGVKFESFGWCTRDDMPLNGCSPDGFDESLAVGLEIKCPNADTHIKYCIDDQIPSEYFWQLINYFMINKDLIELYFVSYRPENKLKPLFVKEIHRYDVLTFKIGRKAQTMSVNDWVELAEEKSAEMLEAVNEKVESLGF